MKKFCVFCGNTPRSKNLEHVIPQWLIKLTGDPSRKISLGVDLNTENSPLRTYAFNHFKFPSCEKCNSIFGELESKSKPIIENLLNENPVTAYEMNIFLDWLDKVRIGLWLAFFYLDKNSALIEPNYHIQFRVGIYDRMTAIYKTNDDNEGISFIATSTPAFQYSPTCFTLVINKLYFFNLSSLFFVSRRVGFPFPKYQSYDPAIGKVAVDISNGLNRTMYPLIRKAIWGPCKQFYQPMFSSQELNSDLRNQFYNNEYVKQNSLDWQKGIGCVFLQHNGQIGKYPKYRSLSWIPEKALNREIIKRKIENQTLDFQIYMMSFSPIQDSLDKDHKKFINMQVNMAKSVNRKLMNKR